jgi:hypothetical protein
MCIIDVIKQEELDSSSVLGVHAKVYAARSAGGAEGEGLSFRHTLISQSVAHGTYRCLGTQASRSHSFPRLTQSFHFV